MSSSNQGSSNQDSRPHPFSFVLFPQLHLNLVRMSELLNRCNKICRIELDLNFIAFKPVSKLKIAMHKPLRSYWYGLRFLFVKDRISIFFFKSQKIENENINITKVVTLSHHFTFTHQNKRLHLFPVTFNRFICWQRISKY